jgi:hypothetical protein
MPVGAQWARAARAAQGAAAQLVLGPLRAGYNDHRGGAPFMATSVVYQTSGRKGPVRVAPPESPAVAISSLLTNTATLTVPSPS